MRLIYTSLMLLVLWSTPALSQVTDLSVAPSADKATQVYTIQFIEFRTKPGVEFTDKGRDFTQTFEKAKTDGKVELVESMRLTALEKNPISVSFSKNIAITTGATQTQFGRSRNMQQMQIGTSVEGIAMEKDGKVILNFTYQSSRLGIEKSEDVTPDIMQTSFKVSLPVELDALMLVGMQSTESTTGLLVKVSK